MATRQKKNSRLSGMAIPVICLCILGYFGFHAYQGNLGVKSRSLMDRQSLQLQFELARLREVHYGLELQVGLLRDGRVEKDMLDQQARHMLNLVKENELVIFYQ
jgi:cell division protein FtsB